MLKTFPVLRFEARKEKTKNFENILVNLEAELSENLFKETLIELETAKKN